MSNPTAEDRHQEAQTTPEDAPPESSSSFGELLSQFEQSHAAEAVAGGAREGTVVQLSADSVFVDVGLKTEGTLPLAEFRDAAGNAVVKRGDHFPVSITGRDPEGYYQLSRLKVERPRDWTSLQRAFDEKANISGTVTATIKGGLSVDVGIRAFMPASRSGARDAAELEKLVGQEITCRIIKLDVADEDVVVDRRAVLEEEEKKGREQRIAALKEGDIVQGTVRSLTDFGAFVDIGGMDGLLHVADISWGRVGKPADVLSISQPLEVQILKVDLKRRKISLGLKQLQPDPWTLAGEKYSVGQRIEGTVTRVADFGAFVELEPGLEGLLHLSEMSWSRKARKPSDVVKEGDRVEVMVLGVHGTDRRISLGLKQALGDPWAEAEKRFPAGSVVEGPISSITKFGAFVELGEGLEGMIHVGDISAEKRINHPQEVLKTGQSVRAAVLEVDKQKRRIRLGLKQLQPTSVDEYIAEHKEGDMVAGRVSDISRGRATVELGEGIRATCSMPAPDRVEEDSAAPREAKADVSSLSSMLSARWKRGEAGGSMPAKREAARAGQIRSFRILKLDPSQKKIELELAS